MVGREPEHALVVEHLQKRYGQQLAVDDISFSIRRGEFFGFLGPNGAGKTTTIGCITGLVTLTSGTITVFGHDVGSEYRQARAAIGLSPQDFNFDIFRTASEVLTYNAGFFGLSAPKARARAEDLLTRFGLQEYRNKPVNQLSGGTKRRLSIARALVHEPQLIILDEPTAGVDAELRRTLWRELKEIQKNGVTILLTTHYLEEAERLCERVAIINHGQLLLIEPTQELIRRHGDQKLEDIFLMLTGAAATEQA